MFAIIGEELGLFGGVLVIVMFVLLGIFGLRTAMRAQNQFQSLLAATLTATVVSQAFYNVSYVIGLMPMTGVQLPLISSGGTSTVVTLGAMGLLASWRGMSRKQCRICKAMGDRCLIACL